MKKTVIAIALVALTSTTAVADDSDAVSAMVNAPSTLLSLTKAEFVEGCKGVGRLEVDKANSTVFCHIDDGFLAATYKSGLAVKTGVSFQGPEEARALFFLLVADEFGKPDHCSEEAKACGWDRGSHFLEIQNFPAQDQIILTAYRKGTTA